MMKFDELNQKMRVYETTNDLHVLPGLFMIARVDGRSFTRLTKELCKFEAPFDPVFRDLMINTMQHLMSCGFKFVYGYTQSDEISLLFDVEDDTFDRKLRKLNSVLAGETSAKLSSLLGMVAAFDCRISQLPSIDLVVDYFHWRSEDAHRNALNAHCYWMLRKQGVNGRAANSKMEKLSRSDKNELLFQNGINFNDLPLWQKRGTGCYWENYEKEGYNPISKEIVVAERQHLKVEMDLPMQETYNDFVRNLVKR
jgi:tRNA(His) guanylyltransferase